MGDFLDFHYFIQHCFTCSARKLSNSEIIPAPLYWRTEALLCKWRCGSNSERKLWTRFEFADFFLFWAASLFTLRTFGAQINWHVLSRKVLFVPHRFLSNKLPIHFPGESGKGNVSQWQTARSKWKWTSIATVPDLTTVKILTHLISRNHLPLIKEFHSAP